MKIVKMFDREELSVAIGEEVLDYIGYEGCNDVATDFWIESSEEADPSTKLLNDYFLEHGCQPGEKVYIDVTW